MNKKQKKKLIKKIKKELKRKKSKLKQPEYSGCFENHPH